MYENNERTKKDIQMMKKDEDESHGSKTMNTIKSMKPDVEK